MVTQRSGETGRGEVAAIARRPFWARVSAGQVVMILAALAAFVLNINVLRSQEAVTMVAVATEDLVPGIELEPGMVEFVALDAENPVIERLLTEPAFDAAVGKVLIARVPAGEFVSAAMLADQATDSNLRAMTIPVDASHAGGGSLIDRGDLVDVISVTDGVARYVVTGAQVLEVPVNESGGLVGASDYFVVVAVDADTALAIAEALQADSIEIVLSTGAPEPDRLTLQPDPADASADGEGTDEGSG